MNVSQHSARRSGVHATEVAHSNRAEERGIGQIGLKRLHWIVDTQTLCRLQSHLNKLSESVNALLCMSRNSKEGATTYFFNYYI